jgi:MSHA pilin protein MshA
MKRQQAGMTLIELVIVIIVLGIIAAVAAPKFADVSGNAATAALSGSQDGFKSSYTIAMGSAAVPGAPTMTELDNGIDGLACVLTTGVCTSPDWDKDGNPDLTATAWVTSDCSTTAVTAAGDTVQGYDFSVNGAAAVCQTN